MIYNQAHKHKKHTETVSAHLQQIPRDVIYMLMQLQKQTLNEYSDHRLKDTYINPNISPKKTIKRLKNHSNHTEKTF